jgi:hypothetical protein
MCVMSLTSCFLTSRSAVLMHVCWPLQVGACVSRRLHAGALLPTMCVPIVSAGPVCACAYLSLLRFFPCVFHWTVVLLQACVWTPEEAIKSCNRIGYPVMLKASWGGGGKGIRKVHKDEEVRQVFKQIQGEVSRVAHRQLERCMMERALHNPSHTCRRSQQHMPQRWGRCHISTCHASYHAGWSRGSTSSGVAVVRWCVLMLPAGAGFTHFCHEVGACQSPLGGAAGGGHARQCGLPVHT